MNPDPYTSKLLSSKYPCAAKSTVTGKLVCILDARAQQRGLQLIDQPSRAVLHHEIHELILTAEESAQPGRQVNAISYICYFEVQNGGVLWSGDQVLINGKEIGTLAGYDLTHFPNHMNIVVYAKAPLFTGYEAGFAPGTTIEFAFPGRPLEE